ncbi:M14 family zinc carboxypeptidase [Salininema proteolyticum]|uniref:M14 family zinc carboxypeptidase n=1 Tax=Salininema proteolyticum TaxID=1607685 RepID=A0ABV8TYK5_9ACTN
MRPRKTAMVLAGAAVLAASGLVAANSTAEPLAGDPPDGGPAIWEVSDLSPDEVRDLEETGFDVAEYHDGTADVIGGEAVADSLRERGLDPHFEDSLYKSVADTGVAAEGSYYGGYKTPDLHIDHLDEVAADNPELATAYDVGDSWLKTQGEGGYDIKAICLTDKQEGDCELSPDSAKPRISIVAQIHAREIATGEIAWRYMDYLVEGYGSDDRVTELLDTTEVWIVPIANPDGVDIVASGGDRPVLQRKNANDSGGECGGRFGIDLNRNHSYQWGDETTDPCAETYQGEGAASEPEVQALEGLFDKIHPDQRGEGDGEAAPADTRDVMISLHAYGEYVIVPWGYTPDTPPNDAELRELGGAIASHNGYRVGSGSETVGYTSSGTTDDYTYGVMGIASYTFEVGGQSGECGGFFPQYSCLEGDLWSTNRDALTEAGLAAGAPYGG